MDDISGKMFKRFEKKCGNKMLRRWSNKIPCDTNDIFSLDNKRYI